MAAVKELLRVEEDRSLSFGDYTLASKTKLEDFEFEGDIYKVKTFSEITKLEKNGMFVYESVPGSAAEHFRYTENEVAFQISAPEDVQFTLELEPESEYEVLINEVSSGKMKTHLSGKLSVSIEISDGEEIDVRVVKCDK
ncbi:MAG: endosialidase [Candidatus Ruminococcus intestinipullorum]|nr:endosialidase [Candidatus Ruminococcus intestinipullorum]